MTQYDFAIVGGGMTGATMALALAHMGHESRRPARILLLDQRRLGDGPHQGFDSRAIALSYGSEQILRQLNLHQAFLGGCGTISSIHVSDRGHYGRAVMTAEEYHLPHLGRVVELNDVGHGLLKQLNNEPQIEYLAPASLVKVEVKSTGARLQLADGGVIETPQLLLADGGESHWRSALGWRWLETEYGQRALVTTVQSLDAMPGRAWERFTSEGPLALLPLGDGRFSVVWTLAPEQAEQLMRLDDRLLLQQLQQQFGYRAGRFSRIGQRAIYPLVMRKMLDVVHEGCLLLGNAAHQLHPVAGQGFNLALRDVATFYHLQSVRWLAGKPAGGAELANTYLQQRQADVSRTLQMTHGLAILFASDAKPMILGRSLALWAMNRCAALKWPLVRQALGIQESLR